MLPPPEKLNLEVEVDGFFHNGDKKDVARLVQKDSSTVSRQLSPNSEHNNHVVYTFLVFLWAFDCVRRDLGDSVINLVLRERSKWLGSESVAEHPATLTANVGHQLVEAHETEMRGLSIDDQIREWGDVERAAKAKINALIGQRASTFYGNGTREIAKAAVRHRRGK